jgi:hypothetical protein
MMIEITLKEAGSADEDFSIWGEFHFPVGEKMAVEGDHGTHFREAVCSGDRKWIVGNGRAADEEAAQVFIDGRRAVEMSGDAREVSDVGAVVEDDGGSCEDAADDDADAADVIEGECETPLIIGFEIECRNGPECVGEEVVERENGDFRGRCRAGSEEEERVRGGRGSGWKGESGVDGEERVAAPPCGKEFSDEVDACWFGCDERLRGKGIYILVEFGKCKGTVFGEDRELVGGVSRCVF